MTPFAGAVVVGALAGAAAAGALDFAVDDAGGVDIGDDAVDPVDAAGVFGTLHARPGAATMSIAAQRIRRENMGTPFARGVPKTSTGHGECLRGTAHDARACNCKREMNGAIRARNQRSFSW